jgi:hypothetical protein
MNDSNDDFYPPQVKRLELQPHMLKECKHYVRDKMHIS